MTNNEISRLRKTSNASNTAARALITDDFTRLEDILDQIKSGFDEILESKIESDSDKEIAYADEKTKEDSDEDADEDSDEESEDDSDSESDTD